MFKAMLFSIFVFLFLLSISAAQGKTIHVPGDSTTIQSGINGAVNGDTVLVAPGTYTGRGNRDIDFGGKAIVLKSKDGPEYSIIDCGGVPPNQYRGFEFHSGEGNLSVVDGFTIKSGLMSGKGSGISCDSSSPTITNCTLTENSGTVAYVIYCSSSSPIITNCTISGNNDSGIYCDSSFSTITNCTISNNGGTGISCRYSSLTITNCTISENDYRGIYLDDSPCTISDCTISGNNMGGISCRWYASPTINNCIISGNTADKGGGISIRACSPRITNCTISENTAETGGGIYFYGHYYPWFSSPIIIDCTISGNTATDRGGGITGEHISPTITNCTISGNTAPQGGGIHCFLSSFTIINCTISENNATIDGGGINCYLCDLFFPKITNCRILRNTATYDGGGIKYIESSSTITNCTISENTSTYNGGGICCSSAIVAPEIKNCILYEDAPDEISYVVSDPHVTYSDIQGGWPGEGNIDVDPLFRNLENEDFHLMAIACSYDLDSPCIDSGDPAIIDSILDCSHGLGGTRSDMGAYGGSGEGPNSIEDKGNNPNSILLPRTINLSQNYPNPFNPSTTITFDIPGNVGEKQPVSLAIYDIRGRRVQTLIDSDLEPGIYRIHWDGRNEKGESVTSGIYLYSLINGEQRFTRKMTILK